MARSAWHILRGYLYQAYRSLERWLELKEGQTLELECDEDIDIVNRALDGTELARELEQVKFSVRSVGLNSPTVRAALVRFAERFRRGPTGVRFRFLTNADAVAERNSGLDLPAIDAWGGLSEGSLRSESPLPQILSLLRGAPRPNSIGEGEWDDYQAFLADESAFLRFALSVEWSMGGLDVDGTRDRVIELITARKLSASAVDALETHNRLLAHVLHTTASKDAADRVLTRAGLEDAARSEAVEQARARYAHLVEVAQKHGLLLKEHERRLSTLEHDVVDLKRKDATIAPLAISAAYVGPSAAPLLPRAHTPRACVTAEIQSKLAPGSWFALYGPMGCGKSVLANLVSRGLGSVAWVSLRHMDPLPAAAYIKACAAALGSHPASETSWSLVVVDDLPRLGPDGILEASLVDLLLVARRKAVPILSTSAYAVQEELPWLEETGSFQQRRAPKLTVEEMREFLSATGAPERHVDGRFPEFLLHLTGGNAILASAAVAYLVAHGWETALEVIRGLFRHDHARRPVEEGLRRLVEQIRDPESRTLLFRLAAIHGFFGEDSVDALAEVPPAIAHGRQYLPQLEGAWVERLPTGVLQLPDLVREMGLRQLPPATFKSCTTRLIRHLRRDGTISILDVPALLEYLSRVGLDTDAGQVVHTVLHSAESESVAAARFAEAIVDNWWPRRTKVPESLRILLCSARLRVRDMLGTSTRDLIEECFSILDSDGIEPAVIYIFGVTTSYPIAKTDFDAGCRAVRLGIDAYPRISSEVLGMGSFPTRRRWDAIWFLSSLINTPRHLAVWLDLISALPICEHSALFEDANLASVSSRIAVEQAASDYEKRQEQSVELWQELFCQYRDAAIRFSETIPTLAASAARGGVLVLTDHLRDLDAGLSYAESALTLLSDGPCAALAIGEAITNALVFFGRQDSAAPWAQRAVSATCECFPRFRWRAIQHMSALLGESNPERAVMLMKEAFAISVENPLEFGDVEIAATLGECGLACWLAGDWRTAFEQLDEALQLMRRQTARTDLWKDKFILLSHTIGAFASVANFGRIPEKTATGEAYATPYRGMFLTRSLKRSAQYVESRDDMTTATLAHLAQAVGNHRRAFELAAEGAAAARRNQNASILAFLGVTLTAQAISEHDWDAAFRHAEETLRLWDKILPAGSSNLLPEGGEFMPRHEPLTEKHDPLLFDLVVIPAVVGILGRYPDTAALGGLADRCRRVPSPRSVRWNAVGDVLDCAARRPTWAELAAAAEGARKAGVSQVAVVGNLLAVYCSDAEIDHVAVRHIAVGEVISTTLPSMKYIIESGLRGYWIGEFERQPYRLITPTVMVEELRDESVDTRGICRLLVTALRIPEHLGSRTGGPGHAFRRTWATGAKRPA